MNDVTTISLDSEDIPDSARRIMIAAISLFGRKGYAATRVREIVQEANVTNPMLYYYFDNKEGLFQHTLQTLFLTREKSLREIIESEDGFEDKLRTIVRFHLDSMRERPQTVDFVYSVIFGARESQPSIDVHAMVEPTTELVNGFLRGAIEEGSLLPHDSSASVLFLTETLLGMVGMHLIKVQKMMASEQVPRAAIDAHLGEEAVERLVMFFVKGAGELRRRKD